MVPRSPDAMETPLYTACLLSSFSLKNSVTFAKDQREPDEVCQESPACIKHPKELQSCYIISENYMPPLMMSQPQVPLHENYLIDPTLLPYGQYMIQ